MSAREFKTVARKKSSDAEDWDWSSTARFEVRFPVEFLKAVDLWRGQQEDVPNRSEAIRRLVELGITRDKRNATKAKAK
jgi:metal-responsive CopG/Arc/MetJ family transcriptional regulator